jgi:hypothetical protein
MEEKETEREREKGKERQRERKIERQFFRLVIGPVSAWYADHSTANPLGFILPQEVLVLRGDKFSLSPSLSPSDSYSVSLPRTVPCWDTGTKEEIEKAKTFAVFREMLQHFELGHLVDVLRERRVVDRESFLAQEFYEDYWDQEQGEQGEEGEQGVSSRGEGKDEESQNEREKEEEGEREKGEEESRDEIEREESQETEERRTGSEGKTGEREAEAEGEGEEGYEGYVWESLSTEGRRTRMTLELQMLRFMQEIVASGRYDREREEIEKETDKFTHYLSPSLSIDENDEEDEYWEDELEELEELTDEYDYEYEGEGEGEGEMLEN